MKNRILISVLIIFGTTFNAQAWSGSGDQKIQAGVSTWGYGNGITGTYDYGITNLLSVGGGLNVYFDGYKDHNDDNKFFIFGRLNAHLQEPLNLPEQWDIYPGLDVGIISKTFGLGAHIGVRYFFTEKIGAFLEVGNNGSIGVSFNL